MIENPEKIRAIVNATMAVATTGGVASNLLGNALRMDNTKITDDIEKQLAARAGHCILTANALLALLGVSQQEAISAAEKEIANSGSLK
jgi:hypothetical protein